MKRYHEIGLRVLGSVVMLALIGGLLWFNFMSPGTHIPTEQEELELYVVYHFGGLHAAGDYAEANALDEEVVDELFTLWLLVLQDEPGPVRLPESAGEQMRDFLKNTELRGQWRDLVDDQVKKWLKQQEAKTDAAEQEAKD